MALTTALTNTALPSTANQGTHGTPALTAKIAENFAAARAASDVTKPPSPLTNPPSPVTKPLRRGAAVLFDNPKNGKLELGHVLAFHLDPSSSEIEYYTIKTIQGVERQVEGECPPRRASRSQRRPLRRATRSPRARHALVTARHALAR